jgi:hypothetical protein
MATRRQISEAGGAIHVRVVNKSAYGGVKHFMVRHQLSVVIL